MYAGDFVSVGNEFFDVVLGVLYAVLFL